MAKQFQEAYADRDHRVVHLEHTLASVYKDAYEASLHSLRRKPRSRWAKFKWWLTSIPYPEETASHLYARKILYRHMQALHQKHDFTKCYRTLYTQPHGDKRTAMFTAFAVSLFIGAEAVFATDSDTLLEPTALQEMWILLDSDPNYGAVTADVKIENWKDSFISLQSRLRYWMAFNIERACQSTFRCVTCISGPMALYRACDLDSIIGMWLCQTFLGVHTTFGDDRHLTNCLLGKGLKTAYTHRTCCHSESPSSFIRWIRQQTRWSKSFYREAVWFPRAFAYHHIWLGVETMKQGLYPFILLATVFNILYGQNPWLRLVTWAGTMFGTAAFKGLLAWIISRDWRMILFPGYPLLYFFGLLPSKVLALSTMGKTNWGTSARTASERGRGESLGQKSWHVGHLAIFYLILITGLAHFIVHITGIVWLWFIPFVATVPVAMLYWDELPFKYWILALKDRRKSKQSYKTPNSESLCFGPEGNPGLATAPANGYQFHPGIRSGNVAYDDPSLIKMPFFAESSSSRSSILPPPSFTSEGYLPTPQLPHPARKSSGGYQPVATGSTHFLADDKKSYMSLHQDASYAATPPYPPPVASTNRRQSALDILDSGAQWPNLPPPVVTAKGTWVWQPESPPGDLRPSDGKLTVAGDLHLPMSRKPSWIETPPTPGSVAPPYPASASGENLRFQGGSESPFSNPPSFRAGWSQQQAHGGGGTGAFISPGARTPDDGNSIYSAADEYTKQRVLSGSETGPSHSGLLAPRCYSPHGSERTSDNLSLASSVNGASSPFPYRNYARASSSSTSSDHSRLLTIGALPQPPWRSSSRQQRQPHPLVQDWSGGSGSLSPVTSLRTLTEPEASPDSSSVHAVQEEYESSNVYAGDDHDSLLGGEHRSTALASRRSSYLDPFAPPRPRCQADADAQTQQRRRVTFHEEADTPLKASLLQSRDDRNPYNRTWDEDEDYEQEAVQEEDNLVPPHHLRRDFSRWSDTSALDDDWSRRSARTTTYGGLLDVYALSQDIEDESDLGRSYNHNPFEGQGDKVEKRKSSYSPFNEQQSYNPFRTRYD